MASKTDLGKDLIAALTGDKNAHTRFLSAAADIVWKVCLLLGSKHEAEQNFDQLMGALEADDCARLRTFTGKVSAETFLILTARDLLATNIRQRLKSDTRGGWLAFERFFAADIQRLIRKRLPGSSYQEVRCDAYQEICASLVADDYRRLDAYRGPGGFSAFVLRTADRVLIDYLRSLRSRRALPDARQTALSERIAHDVPSPEEAVIANDEERLLANASEILNRASADLNERQRLYVAISLGAPAQLPPREIARLMGCPVEEVYKLKTHVMEKLRAAIEDDITVKNWRVSVSQQGKGKKGSWCLKAV